MYFFENFSSVCLEFHHKYPNENNEKNLLGTNLSSFPRFSSKKMQYQRKFLHSLFNDFFRDSCTRHSFRKSVFLEILSEILVRIPPEVLTGIPHSIPPGIPSGVPPGIIPWRFFRHSSKKFPRDSLEFPPEILQGLLDKFLSSGIILEIVPVILHEYLLRFSQ